MKFLIALTALNAICWPIVLTAYIAGIEIPKVTILFALCLTCVYFINEWYTTK